MINFKEQQPKTCFFTVLMLNLRLMKCGNILKEFLPGRMQGERSRKIGKTFWSPANLRRQNYDANVKKMNMNISYFEWPIYITSSLRQILNVFPQRAICFQSTKEE
jgi:hypothetical protein